MNEHDQPPQNELSIEATDVAVPVAVTHRSGVIESLHHGVVLGLDQFGQTAISAGNPAATVYPRSANKPLQAAAMVELGLDLTAEQLAVVCASHDGTPYHRHLAEGILASVGLSPDALANTPDLPLDRHAAEAVLRDGGHRASIHQNCSGKHSGMLATCVVNGWPTDGYLAPDHPLQHAITATVADLAGTVSHIGVDGCGAPAHTVTLEGLVRAFATIAGADPGSPCGRVAAAMRDHPVAVGGERRAVTRFMQFVPGLVAKDGAEGVFAAALPDGRAVGIKVADGASRACAAVMIAALEALGVDVEDMSPRVVEPVLGHGNRVGEVSAIVRFAGPGRG